MLFIHMISRLDFLKCLSKEIRSFRITFKVNAKMFISIENQGK